MTGVEHYREAERLSQARENPFGGQELPGAEALAAAQVHATLAVAERLGEIADALGALTTAQDERGQ